MRERMSWDELVRNYPNSWVVLDNAIFEDNERCMFVESGEFIETLSNEEAAIKWGDLQNSESNTVIAYTGDKHSRAIVTPCVRMSWDDLEKEYPDMWVILKDAVHEDNNPMDPNIESGIVMCSATDDHVDEFWATVKDCKLKYYVIRTSDNFPSAFIGVTL